MKTIMRCLSVVWEGFYDCYWTIYKSQLPNPKHCLDDGPEFVSSLTFLGWLLYKIRPLMVRRRHRSNSPPVPYKQRTKEKRDTTNILYDPTTSRLYFSLVAWSLHKVVSGYLRHYSNQTSETITEVYDNIKIISYTNDKSIVQTWFNTDAVAYLLTLDTCELPCFDDIVLDAQIKRTLYLQNAGGSSEISESLSMHYMKLRFGATNFIPEKEVQYYYDSKICDYLMDVNQSTIGVSVTRAIAYPPNKTITPTFALSLLHKKLIGMVVARQYVSNVNKFDLSIVHIWCKSTEDAEVVIREYNDIVDKDVYNLYSGIQVICSVCSARFIYSNVSSDM